MKALRSSGTPTLSGETRRVTAWRNQPGKVSLRVPLWHGHPDGEWRQGLIRVPDDLCHADANTNQAHARDKLITSMLRRWQEWLSMKGWEMSSPPQVTGPFDPATANPLALPEEQDLGHKWYFAMARFKLRSPLYAGLDDVLETQRVSDLYGITVDKDPLPWNDTTGTYDSGWVDPIKERDESNAKQGIKREDYLYPESLTNALGS